MCPPQKMRNGLFTTATVDNTDHNPSLGTAKDSFHGNGICLMQHPTHECAGSDRGLHVINQCTPSTRSICPLPQPCTSVLPVALKTKQFTAPSVNGPLRPLDFQMATKTRDEEYEWLRAVMAALEVQEMNKVNWVSWSDYYADFQQTVIPPADISALLPLFLDNTHSVAMIKHSKDIFRAAGHQLNPGQVPIL